VASKLSPLFVSVLVVRFARQRSGQERASPGHRAPKSRQDPTAHPQRDQARCPILHDQDQHVAEHQRASRWSRYSSACHRSLL
jgi:hypothetical protein